ncbi:M15 family metallopeptidase [Oleidesulfovibrio sp.]|uniref:M15 family metallopeptidase n=1 Tax=Oleidesulfovibrio sp. TaxID=2909707 RepID=UPI003A8AEB04
MQNRTEVPIPCAKDFNWNDVYAVSIAENEEPLVPLSLVPEKILVRSAYFEAGIGGALPECYARAEVFEKLLCAANLLPAGLRMVVLDAWRSPQVQTVLFQRCRSALSRAYKDATDAELHELTQQYVARPSFDASAPSPHVTGGAIDLALATRDGKMLFFGSPFDYPERISYTCHLEEKASQGVPLTAGETEALKNRRLLYSVMLEAGFVNYSCEWWHYEYGTQRWALESGEDFAVYGPTRAVLNYFESFEKMHRDS